MFRMERGLFPRTLPVEVCYFVGHMQMDTQIFPLRKNSVTYAREMLESALMKWVSLRVQKYSWYPPIPLDSLNSTTNDLHTGDATDRRG